MICSSVIESFEEFYRFYVQDTFDIEKETLALAQNTST